MKKRKHHLRSGALVAPVVAAATVLSACGTAKPEPSPKPSSAVEETAESEVSGSSGVVSSVTGQGTEATPQPDTVVQTAAPTPNTGSTTTTPSAPTAPVPEQDDSRWSGEGYVIYRPGDNMVPVVYGPPPEPAVRE